MAAAVCRQDIFCLRYEVLSISLQSSLFIFHFLGLSWMCPVCQGRRVAVAGPQFGIGMVLLCASHNSGLQKKKAKLFLNFEIISDFEESWENVVQSIPAYSSYRCPNVHILPCAAVILYLYPCYCCYWWNHLKVSCRHDAPLPLSTSVCKKTMLFSIINTVIKLMTFILSQYCYLIHRPYSKGTNCPTDLLCNKRKQLFPNLESNSRSPRLSRTSVSDVRQSPGICLLGSRHFWSVQASYLVEFSLF